MRDGVPVNVSYKYSHVNSEGAPLNTSIILENNQRFVAVKNSVQITLPDGTAAIQTTYSGEIYDVSDPDNPIFVKSTEIFDVYGVDLFEGQTAMNNDEIIYGEDDVDESKRADDNMVRFDIDDDGDADDEIDVKFKSGRLNALRGVFNANPTIENDTKMIVTKGKGALKFNWRTKGGRMEGATEGTKVEYPSLEED